MRRRFGVCAASRLARLLAVVFLGALVGFAGSGCGGGSADNAPDPSPDRSVAEVEEGEAVTVYFPGQGGRLFAEERKIAKDLSVEDRARAIVEILLSGPDDRALFPPLSSEIELINLEVDTTGGIAWVDLGGKNDDLGGSHRELLTVYSLVDSLAMGVEEIDRVALLWNGNQGESFAGHVDTTQPLGPDASYINRTE